MASSVSTVCSGDAAVRAWHARAAGGGGFRACFDKASARFSRGPSDQPACITAWGSEQPANIHAKLCDQCRMDYGRANNLLLPDRAISARAAGLLVCQQTTGCPMDTANSSTTRPQGLGSRLSTLDSRWECLPRTYRLSSVVEGISRRVAGDDPLELDSGDPRDQACSTASDPPAYDQPLTGQRGHCDRSRREPPFAIDRAM